MESESNDLINLILSKKLETLSLRVNDKHPRVDETSNVWVSLAVDSLNVSFWLKFSIHAVVIKLAVFLPCFVSEFLELIDAVDLVREWLVKVSGDNMDVLLDLRDITIVDTRSVNSRWLVHHFKVISVVSKSASFIIIVDAALSFV